MKKHLKAIAVMVSIMLVCGGLLAILSDLLYVSNEERIQRAINKIYTEEVSLVKTLDLTTVDTQSFSNYGEIKSCYAIDNGDYLILSTGKNGYSNGTVTLYVSISVIEGVPTVKNTVQDSYTGQTLMSKLTSLYQRFTGKTANLEKEEVNEIVTGATFSSRATSNAVYCALQLVTILEGGAL